MQSYDEYSSLRGRVLKGSVLKTDDPQNQQRALVHIPAIMPNVEDPLNTGLWLKQLGNNMNNGERGTHGSNIPVHPGDKVCIECETDDFNSGKIYPRDVYEHCRGQDQSPDPKNPTDPKEQSMEYTLLKTGRSDNNTGFTSIMITEATEKEGDMINIVYGRDGEPERHSVISVSQEGIVMSSRGNIRSRGSFDNNSQQDGQQTQYIVGNQQTNVEGNSYTNVLGTEVKMMASDVYYSNNGIQIDNYNNTWHSLCSSEKRETIEGEFNGKYMSDVNINIDGDYHLKVKGDLFIEVTGDMKVSAQNIYLKGMSGVFIDGPPVLINGGHAQKVTANDAIPAIASPVDVVGPIMVATRSASEMGDDNMTGQNSYGQNISPGTDKEKGFESSNRPNNNPLVRYA